MRVVLKDGSDIRVECRRQLFQIVRVHRDYDGKTHHRLFLRDGMLNRYTVSGIAEIALGMWAKNHPEFVERVEP